MISKANAQDRIWKALEFCYDNAARLPRYSTDESDQFFEAADACMEAIAEHRGELEQYKTKPEEE